MPTGSIPSSSVGNPRLSIIDIHSLSPPTYFQELLCPSQCLVQWHYYMNLCTISIYLFAFVDSKGWDRFFHTLVCSLNAHKRQVWVKPKPGVQNSMGSPTWVAGTQVRKPLLAISQSSLAESWNQSRDRIWTQSCVRCRDLSLVNCYAKCPPSTMFLEEQLAWIRFSTEVMSTFSSCNIMISKRLMETCVMTKLCYFCISIGLLLNSMFPQTCQVHMPMKALVYAEAGPLREEIALQHWVQLMESVFEQNLHRLKPGLQISAGQTGDTCLRPTAVINVNLLSCKCDVIIGETGWKL